MNYSPDVEAYMVANNFQRINKSGTSDYLVFTKGALAVIFLGDRIEVKQADALTGTRINNILFQWKTLKRYDGFDGYNIFQLMMLLDFMGAISIKEINKELRQQINVATVTNLPLTNFQIPAYAHR